MAGRLITATVLALAVPLTIAGYVQATADNGISTRFKGEQSTSSTWFRRSERQLSKVASDWLQREWPVVLAALGPVVGVAILGFGVMGLMGA